MILDGKDEEIARLEARLGTSLLPPSFIFLSFYLNLNCADALWLEDGQTEAGETETLLRATLAAKFEEITSLGVRLNAVQNSHVARSELGMFYGTFVRLPKFLHLPPVLSCLMLIISLMVLFIYSGERGGAGSRAKRASSAPPVQRRTYRTPGWD